MKWGAVALLAGVVLLGLAPSAGAHGRSVSYSSWVLGFDGVSVRVRLSLLDLSRLGLVRGGEPEPEAVLAYLLANLELRADARLCAVVSPPELRLAREGWVEAGWRVDCGAPANRTLHSRLLVEVAPSHLHFARVEDPEGGIRERVLTRGSPTWVLGGQDSRRNGATDEWAGTGLAGYVALGFEHILSGWDHLAFVLALLLLAQGVGEVARLVTGFTVAHSVTLALAATGVLDPDGATIEALIGFSIALVAAENAWLLAGRPRAIPAALLGGLLAMLGASWLGFGIVSATSLLGLTIFTLFHFLLLGRVAHPERLRVAVAFAFGLIHGFGFAGVLSQLSLPADRMLPALFGFNVGVEVGQLAVVFAAWPLLRLMQWLSAARGSRLVAEVGSAGIFGVGLFWFVERCFG